MISEVSVDYEVKLLMPCPPFLLPETWFQRLSLDISGETSSSLWVLLGGVKPVWAGAQGDRTGWALTEWEPMSMRFFWWVLGKICTI